MAGSAKRDNDQDWLCADGLDTGQAKKAAPERIERG
jgi:hypothetical protein